MDFVLTSSIGGKAPEAQVLTVLIRIVSYPDVGIVVKVNPSRQFNILTKGSCILYIYIERQIGQRC